MLGHRVGMQQSWPPNPGLPNSNADTGLHPNLATRDTMITDSQNPREHAWVISYSMFITKHDTLEEKKAASLPKTKDEAEALLYIILTCN